MNATILNQVNNKLKSLPDSLAQEVVQFVDYLTFRHAQNDAINDVPQWQQNLVLDRMNNPQKTVDAFEMLHDMEKRA